MSIRCTVAIQREDCWFIAKCLETGVASQGKTMDEAIDNLKEAIALYYEDNLDIVSIEPIFVTNLEVAI